MPPKRPKLRKELLVNLPANLLADLNDLLSRGGLSGMTIHDLPQGYFASGSEVTQKQFALFRAIFPVQKEIKTLLWDLIELSDADPSSLNRAEEILNESAEFSRYLSILTNDIPIHTLNECSENWPGSFKAVRLLQEQTATVGGVHDRERLRAQRSPRPQRQAKRRLEPAEASDATANPRKTIGKAVGRAFLLKKKRDAEDEATPNAALIVFLQCLLHLIEGSKFEAVHDRIQLKAEFRNGGYNAYTDGVIRTRSGHTVLSIVEVKRMMRDGNRERISMQEAVEVTGLIHSQLAATLPVLNRAAIMLSQDRHLIYVTLASYSQDYLDYLNQNTMQNALLNMQTYGPFNTSKAKDMKLFGTFVVALILLAQPLA
ncbi:hypothetical protein V8E54_012309 [Elaphomyces granulatus]